ncbi:hypothetical protein CMO92_00635 [Candidatus Woesearchaeota archaeon]|nr:hypothetical protein [Candidatus Woesearchaeota archaeon]
MCCVFLGGELDNNFIKKGSIGGGMGIRLPAPRSMKRDASFSKRFIALLIDLLVINVVIVLPFSGLFEGLSYSFAELESVQLPPQLLVAIGMISLLSLFYFTLLQYFVGKSIGDHFMKISVDGKPGFWKCLLRNVFVIPFFPFYLLWVIEPLHLIFYRNRLLDKWMGLRMVERVMI